MAIIDIKKAIEIDSRQFAYYQLLDYALFKGNELDEIIRYWGKYIELVPTDSRAYFERAGTYYHKKDINSAMNDARKAADMGNKEAEQLYLRLKEKIK